MFNVGDKVLWTWNRDRTNGNHPTIKRTITTTHEATVKNIYIKMIRIEIDGTRGKTALVDPDTLTLKS